MLKPQARMVVTSQPLEGGSGSGSQSPTAAGGISSTLRAARHGYLLFNGARKLALVESLDATDEALPAAAVSDDG